MAGWERIVASPPREFDPFEIEGVTEIMRRHGLEEVVELHWNENLIGPLPGVLEAAGEELERTWMYPEEAYQEFRAEVAASLGLRSRRAARRCELAAARQGLVEKRRDAAAAPLALQANFVTARVGGDDLQLAEDLAWKGILVRPGSDAGLPGDVRITIGPAQLMRRVSAELGKARSELGG